MGSLKDARMAWAGEVFDPPRVRGSLRFGTFERTRHNSGECAKGRGAGEMLRSGRAQVGVAAKSGLADTSGLCPC